MLSGCYHHLLVPMDLVLSTTLVRRVPRQRLVETLLLLMPCVASAQTPLAGCWPEEAHAWRHTHASTYSNFLKIGLSPCKEGASSRLRENRG